MNSEKRTAIILGIGILVTVVGISLSFSVLDNSASPSVADDSNSKSGYKKAPELVGISGYINTLPEELQAKIKDSVVLYDIWTYTCINCIRTLPFITAWDEKYSDQGLLIIGIHSPEFEFEKNIDNIKAAVSKYGIKYPVVLDNDKKTWNAFENNYWPRKYIADSDGYIRYDHIGEGGYQETEKVIQDLLKERAESLGVKAASSEPLVDIQEFEHSWLRTPELYFGYKFAQGRNQLGNPEGFRPNSDVTYSVPESLNRHSFYLDGTWTNLEDSMRLVSGSGSIALPYSGKEVNIVTANEADLQVFIDGKIIEPSIAGTDIGSNGMVHVDDARLYNLVSSEQSEQHTIKILVNNPGFEIFTFTFG